MSSYQCFFPNCSNEVECICPCTSPGTYICELHLGKHIKMLSGDHKYEFFLCEPYEGTKDAVLRFLDKEKSKQVKAKEKLIEAFGKNLSDPINEIKGSIRGLESDLCEINASFNKIMQTEKVSKFDKDPIIKTLNSNPEEAIAKLKVLLTSKFKNYKIILQF
ncbi:unnamed protein product [Blepharisma stoltei]|uniref:Uncharacterized protein n=1 Tax=Blepharisma stoltei TaxID=1481888 RepID=A0AAU9J2C8_9CILI|nr:unnamed protein product [Blepharisma stoltei]